MSNPATASLDRMQAAVRDGDGNKRETERALVATVFRSATQDRAATPPPADSQLTISHTELPAPRPHSPVAREWDFYRREVGNLLAAGQEGRFVLIKGEAVVGTWDTQEEAEAAALQRYPMQPCLIHEVRRREPLLRLSPRLQQWLS